MGVAPGREAGAPAGGPRLVVPGVAYHRSFLGALAEYHAEGRNLQLDAVRLTDPTEFARYVQTLRDDVDHPGAPDRYVLRAFGTAAPDPPVDGYVPQTVLWWVDGREYLGRLNIRHRLNEGLLRRGGNIGYEVRPSARWRGHATAMLATALPLAAALGIEEARLDCDADMVREIQQEVRVNQANTYTAAVLSSWERLIDIVKNAAANL